MRTRPTWRRRPGAPALAALVALGAGLLAPAAAHAQAAPQAQPAPQAPPPAQKQPPAPRTLRSAPEPRDPDSDFTRFGAQLDVGFPEGVGVAAIFRPLKVLRLHAGVVTNTAGFAPRVGLTLAPIDFVITPAVGVEAGRYFDTDYARAIDRFGGDPGDARTLLEEVGLTYVQGTAGFDLGSTNRFQFFLRAGLAYAQVRAENAEAFLREQSDDPTIRAEPVDLRFVGPSVKLGFTLYLF